jgi:hypothetical protein
MCVPADPVLRRSMRLKNCLAMAFTTCIASSPLRDTSSVVDNRPDDLGCDHGARVEQEPLYEQCNWGLGIGGELMTEERLPVFHGGLMYLFVGSDV